MVPILLVLAIAFVTQTVPKPAPPPATVVSAPDTLRTLERVCPPAPEPSYEDSLDCEL